MGRTYGGDYNDRLEEGQATMAGAPQAHSLTPSQTPYYSVHKLEQC
jgi:hypothetical protein